jgi:hypothetical protein
MAAIFYMSPEGSVRFGVGICGPIGGDAIDGELMPA